MQASEGALQATILISSLFTFSVLLIVSALALNAATAAVVLVAAVLLFGLLRPI